MYIYIYIHTYIHTYTYIERERETERCIHTYICIYMCMWAGRMDLKENRDRRCMQQRHAKAAFHKCCGQLS